MIARQPWAGYLVALGLLAVVATALPDGPLRDVLHVLVALSCAAAVLVAVRLHRPRAPGAWFALAGGAAAWALGDAATAWWPGAAGPAGIEVGDLLRMASYPLLLVAAARLARVRTTERDPLAMLDAAIFATSLALVVGIVQGEPMWRLVAEPDVSTVVALVWPIGNVMLVSAVFMVALSPGAGRRGAIALALVLTAFEGWDLVSAWLSGPQATLRPESLDPRWLFGYVLAGALVLHPAMRRFSEPSPPRPPRTHLGPLIYLFAALTVGPGLLLAQRAAGREVTSGPVAIGTYVLMALLTARMYVMIRRIDRLATTDELTGLPNRRALQAIAARRLAGRPMEQALLLLDLDRFKEVNDSLGHHAGDSLLVEVARRLRERLRDGDLLARLGGDEFAVLVDGVGRGGAQALARDLATALEAPFELDELAVHTSASIGVAMFPEHGENLAGLLRRADMAMYRAKEHGPVAMAGEGAQEWLVADLRIALRDHQLVCHYQPKVDLRSGEVTGVEALVRWQHPVRGLLYPDAFLPVVESAGLMHAMTRAVLTQVLNQAVTWRDAGRRLTVAVNLSASTLVDADLPDEVAALLRARDLPPSALQLEITEEFLMADRARARAVLGGLRERGVRIAVDDFGTGYSSLAYLRDLPIDELKLDRSFVFPMSDDPRAAALVESTVGLAHSLQLRMVAEGVEDARAYQALARMGCDEAQGYHLSRPVDPWQLERWLDERGALPAPRSGPEPRSTTDRTRAH